MLASVCSFEESSQNTRRMVQTAKKDDFFFCLFVLMTRFTYFFIRTLSTCHLHLLIQDGFNSSSHQSVSTVLYQKYRHNHNTMKYGCFIHLNFLFIQRRKKLAFLFPHFQPCSLAHIHTQSSPACHPSSSQQTVPEELACFQLPKKRVCSENKGR